MSPSRTMAASIRVGTAPTRPHRTAPELLKAALLVALLPSIALGQSSSGRSVVSDVGPLPATIGGLRTTVARHTAGWISCKDVTPACVGDGSTDDTAAIQAAIAAGSVIYFPPGIYNVSSTLLLTTGKRLTGFGYINLSNNTATTVGASVIRMTDSSKTLIEIDNSSVQKSTIEIDHLMLAGPGNLWGSGAFPTGAGHGVYAHGSLYGGPSRLNLHHLAVQNFGGKGIYAPLLWSSELYMVDVDFCGDNLVELQGGNTTSLTQVYAHRVNAGKAGFRIYQGSPTMNACNGIDLGSGAGAYWGIFGSVAADGDPAGDQSFQGTFLGCNIEEGQPVGMYLKTNARPFLRGNGFTASATANYVAILFQGDPSPGMDIDDSNRFAVGGTATWKNGYAIHTHATNVPMFRGRVPGVWDGTFNKVWDDTNGIARNCPTVLLNGQNNTYNIWPLAVGQPSQQDSSAVRAIRTGTKTWNPGTIANADKATTTVSIAYSTLAGDGGCAVPAFSLALPAGVEIFAKVTADNVVTVTIYNWSGSPQTVNSGTLDVIVFRTRGT